MAYSVYLNAIFIAHLQRPAAGGEGGAKERSDCAGHRLKVVAIGISFGFDFDVFHCSVVVSVYEQT